MTSTNEYPFVSVVCPVYNEEEYIELCLRSLLYQDYPHSRMEIILADGMSGDCTRDIALMFSETEECDISILLVDNEKRIASAGMNEGIKVAKGEYIVRIDAHASYPCNYLSELINAIQRCRIEECSGGCSDSTVENVGGVCHTLPGADNDKARGIAVALSTPFGMGPSYFRIGIDKMRFVDTVPFGCFRRNLFDRIGYFDEELIRNQDDEFNGRIICNGGKILLLPNLVVDYYGRKDYKSLRRMFYQYGFFKPKVAKKLGKPMTIRQFAPPVFVIATLLSLFLIPFLPYAWLLFIIISTAWLSLSIIAAVAKCGLSKRCIYAVAAYFTVHTAYGCGYLAGLVSPSINFKSSR